MVWVFTLVVLLALPLAQLVSPIWNLPVIPEVGSWFGRGVATEALVIPGDKAIDAQDGLASRDAGRGPRRRRRAARLVEGWHAWAILAWLAGAALTLCWLAVRTALGRRILARCEAADEEWAELLEESAARLGLNRHVRLFESCEIGAAVTVGAINPAIVVPAGSAEWPAAKRRYILSHELAHIKRRDGLVEVLAIVVKSVYWFNPLVWLAVKAARIERERDCDDAVLNAGARPSDYAMFLMDIAADLGTPRGPVWQLSTISQGSNLKERIMCILDPKIDRNRGRRRAGIVSCLSSRLDHYPAFDIGRVADAGAGAGEVRQGEERGRAQEERDDAQGEGAAAPEEDGEHERRGEGEVQEGAGAQEADVEA